jgi:hypothetical protein
VLDRATAAARRVNTPAARVSVEGFWPVVAVKNNARVARLFQPGAARYCVKFNIIAGVYPSAAPAAMAGVFCAHALNCHLVILYQKM